jgi:hypothetical protein
VIGLVAFVSGLLVLPPTPAWHEAAATISRDGSIQTGAGFAAAVREHLLADDALRSVLKQLGAPPGVDAKLARDWPPYSEVERLRGTVRITPTAPIGDGRERVAMFVVDADPERARQVLEKLALLATAADSGETGTAAVDADVQRQLEELRAAERQAGAKLDAFLKQHLPAEPSDVLDAQAPQTSAAPEEFPRATERIGAVDASRHSASGSQFRLLAAIEEANAPSAAGLTENPDWLALKSDLDERMGERDRLLRQLTPLHPQVQAIDAEIEEILLRLDQTPRYLNASQATSPRPAGTPPGTSASDAGQTGAAIIESPSTADGKPPSIGSEQFAAHAAEYESLLRGYEDARRRLAEAESLAKPLPSAGAAGGSAARLVDAPRIVRSEGGDPSRLSVVLLGIASLLAGAATAWACRGAPPVASTFASAAEAARELGLPLLGEIRRGQSVAAAAPRGTLRRAVAARAVRVAEMLLVVFVVAFLLVAVLDSPFLGEALSSPLSAASRIMQRLTQWI